MPTKNTLIKHIIYFKKTHEKHIYFETLVLAMLITIYYYVHPDFNRSILKAINIFLEIKFVSNSLILDCINYFTLAFPIIAIVFAYFNTGNYPQKILRSAMLLNNMIINTILINILAIGLSPVNVAELSLELSILYRQLPMVLILAFIAIYIIVIKPLIPLDIRISVRTKDFTIPLDLLKIINNKESIELNENEQLEVDIIGSKKYLDLIELLAKDPSVSIHKEVGSYYKKYSLCTPEESLFQIILKENEKTHVLFEFSVKPLVTRRVFEPISTLKDSKLISINLILAPKVKRIIELRYPRDKPLGEYLIPIISEELKRKVNLEELDIRTADNKPLNNVETLIPDSDMSIYIYLKSAVSTLVPETPPHRSVETGPHTSPTQREPDIYEKLDELLTQYKLKIREEIW